MTRPTHGQRLGARGELLHDLLLGLVGLLLAAGAIGVALSPGAAFLAKATLVYLVVAGVVWRALRDRPRASLGPASRVTLVRVVITALVAAGIGETASVTLAATLAALALAAVALDAVDGWVARRWRCSSEFGARFDMETDALLILALCVLAWRSGHAGAWVLAGGALRYLFVLGGWLLPWLRRPLPPSRRRQAFCVVQGLGLVVCVAPWPGPPASAWLAAAGLVLLCYSFTVDTLWLARQGRRGAREAGT